MSRRHARSQEGGCGRLGTNMAYLGQVVRGAGDHQEADPVDILLRAA